MLDQLFPSIHLNPQKLVTCCLFDDEQEDRVLYAELRGFSHLLLNASQDSKDKTQALGIDRNPRAVNQAGESTRKPVSV